MKPGGQTQVKVLMPSTQVPPLKQELGTQTSRPRESPPPVLHAKAPTNQPRATGQHRDLSPLLQGCARGRSRAGLYLSVQSGVLFSQWMPLKPEGQVQV